MREYSAEFLWRNPHIRVFNDVIHLDEATPHLHIDYISVGHFDKGLDTRNEMAKAFEKIGGGKGANAINRWRLSEWEVLHQICFAYGIKISELQKSKVYNYTVQEYVEHKDKIGRLEEGKRYFFREKLLEQTRQISDHEKLSKATAFIDAAV